MADKYPVTERTDVLPSKYSWPEKKHGESFNTAANAPNSPKADEDMFDKCFNVTDVYCRNEDNDEY